MGKWLLSRRDRLIVARHEVPGPVSATLPLSRRALLLPPWLRVSMQRGSRPGGTVEVIVSPTESDLR